VWEFVLKIINQQRKSDDMGVRTYSKYEDQMQGIGLTGRSHKSFADVMAEQLAEQQSVFVDESAVLDQQAALSVTSATVRYFELREEATETGTDLFEEKDYVMSNGLQAVMKRHRAYKQMYGVKPVSSSAPTNYSSDASASILPKDFNTVETSPRVAGSASVQASVQQSMARTVI
jgi:hypothetical protein